ncbi:sensor histidine kinase [Brunnivagina elsteri]|uniref:histidine kinase n=1 Tax=Brunnivagina elsteri CCALA 953 TaxID=987040 RepID=A0A2A2TPV6_9CYAN|nr:HAMP domain-containing sensor histidine kinase [Calothrix elsteri]PAX60462.1 ATPase [Calothrix elsteri CCALA 953]
MNNSITADIFAALNILILEYIDTGRFRITGNIPTWLKRFCPRKIKSGMEVLIPEEDFPFLENFLIDAEEFWQKDFENPLKSGIWSNNDLTGKESHFEASAIIVNHQKILIIQLLDKDYIERLSIIQQARENKLNHYQVVKENQKKEILIHCIIHDIAGQLSGINCCLALLEFENLTPKGKERLEIGRRQSIKQEMLIREVLDAFSAEVRSLESFDVDAKDAPNILNAAQQVVDFLTPTFALNKMQLKLAPEIDVTQDWRVIGDKSRLERVITNLTENAFRHSPSESTVVIELMQDDDSILVNIDDKGSGVKPEMVASLFQKFSQGQGKTGRIGLGLYFCRITVERWGGEIGYSPVADGGSRFWFCLPKPKGGFNMDCVAQRRSESTWRCRFPSRQSGEPEGRRREE